MRLDLPDMFRHAETTVKYIDACLEDLRLHQQSYLTTTLDNAKEVDILFAKLFTEAPPNELTPVDHDTWPSKVKTAADGFPQTLFAQPSYELLGLLLSFFFLELLDRNDPQWTEVELYPLDILTDLCKRKLAFHPIYHLINFVRSNGNFHTASWLEPVRKATGSIVKSLLNNAESSNDSRDRVLQQIRECCEDEFILVCEEIMNMDMEIFSDNDEQMSRTEKALKQLAAFDNPMAPSLHFGLSMGLATVSFQNGHIHKAFGYMDQFVLGTYQNTLSKSVADDFWKDITKVLDSPTQFWSERFLLNLYYNEHILPILRPDKSNLLCDTASLTSKGENNRDSKASDDREAKYHSKYISCSYHNDQEESGFEMIARSFSARALDLASLTYEFNFRYVEYWEAFHATSRLSQDLYPEDLSMYI